MNDNVLTVDSVDGRAVRIIYETHSGVIFHITPINLATLRAIQLKASDKFPYPDKEPYQVPDPVEVAFAPGQASAAEDNPEYIEACKAVDYERGKWADETIFKYAAKMPKYPTRQALIDAYIDDLEALRDIAVLPDDNYEAIMLHFVLTWNQVGVRADKSYVEVQSDFSRIIQLAIQTVALTPDEVVSGIRFFRPRISRS